MTARRITDPLAAFVTTGWQHIRPMASVHAAMPVSAASSPWDISGELERLLVPVQVRPAFRDELHHALLTRSAALLTGAEPPAMAGLEVAPSADPSGRDHRMALWPTLSTGTADKRWIWGAAAVGSALSLAGLWVFAQHHNRPRPAISA